MIVMKFGGTSVEDSDAVRNVAEIVRAHLPRRPLVVVSACAGITNSLLRLATLASQRDTTEALSVLRQIRTHHEEIVSGLFSGATARALRHTFSAYGEELSTLVKGVAVLGELTPRSLDTFVSFGERMSSLLIHHHFLARRIPSSLVDARSFMITDEQFTRAVPYPDRVRAALRAKVVPLLARKRVVLTQGFLGATIAGITTTLGRGGSDFSAAFVGSILDATAIQIWTDVDGILTADPSIVREARNIKTLSFREAAELAYFGARVLHPDTILPAVKRNIPVYVLNSQRPHTTGTLVVSRPQANGEGVVKSIAYKEGITLLNIVSTRMFLAHGFLEVVFDVFHKYRTVVHTVATSDVSITVAIDDVTNLENVVRELRTFATVTVSRKKAIVCVVGERLKKTPGIAARVLGAIGTIEINMISQGASEINISVVINESAIATAVRRLHDEFFRKKQPRRSGRSGSVRRSA